LSVFFGPSTTLECVRDSASERPRLKPRVVDTLATLIQYRLTHGTRAHFVREASMRRRHMLLSALWLALLAQPSVAQDCVNSPAIAKCLELAGPGYNIVNHHGRRTLTWSMKVKNSCDFDVKGRLAYVNGASSPEIVFPRNAVSYPSCDDDCKGAASVTPICGLAPSG
jgi:hypothetical protein